MMNVTTQTKKPRGMIAAFPRDKALLAQVFAAARNHNPRINGLTHATATHAVMQASGDPVFYMVEVTPAQARALGFVEL
jgi:hypothetical protein